MVAGTVFSQCVVSSGSNWLAIAVSYVEGDFDASLYGLSESNLQGYSSGHPMGGRQVCRDDAGVQ